MTENEQILFTAVGKLTQLLARSDERLRRIEKTVRMLKNSAKIC